MTARIDPATVLDEAAGVELADVFEKAQRGPLAGKTGGEHRMLPMGKDGQPRAVVVELIRRRVRK